MSLENWITHNDDVLVIVFMFLIVAGGILAFLYWFLRGDKNGNG